MDDLVLLLQVHQELQKLHRLLDKDFELLQNKQFSDFEIIDLIELLKRFLLKCTVLNQLFYKRLLSLLGPLLEAI